MPGGESRSKMDFVMEETLVLSEASYASRLDRWHSRTVQATVKETMFLFKGQIKKK